jgi:hypothetical protein
MKSEIINEFAEACEHGDVEKLHVLTKYNQIDVNFENGYFGMLAAMNGNVKVLEFLSRCGADMHIDHEAILKASAHNGHIGCVNYLLRQHNANPLELFNTTAYNNYEEVENIFTQYLKEEKVGCLGDACGADDSLIEV